MNLALLSSASKTYALPVRDHVLCTTYYRCVGYMVITGEAYDPTDLEEASVAGSDTIQPDGGNGTLSDGYMENIVASLGIKSFE